jgi:peptidoglycan hydrolase CwlO-like protein
MEILEKVVAEMAADNYMMKKQIENSGFWESRYQALKIELEEVQAENERLDDLNTDLNNYAEEVKAENAELKAEAKKLKGIINEEFSLSGD